MLPIEFNYFLPTYLAAVTEITPAAEVFPPRYEFAVP